MEGKSAQRIALEHDNALMRSVLEDIALSIIKLSEIINRDQRLPARGLVGDRILDIAEALQTVGLGPLVEERK